MRLLGEGRSTMSSVRIEPRKELESPVPTPDDVKVGSTVSYWIDYPFSVVL